jgi:hypothetical protein
MRRPITTEVVLTQLQRLNAVFPKYGDTDFRALSHGYREALEDLDAEQLHGAVSLAIREEKRFPAPAVIREHARTWSKANRTSVAPVELSDENVLCKVCGAKPRLAWIEGWDHATQQPRQLQRFIGSCIVERHPIGSWHVPLPQGFLEWV